MSPDAMYSRQSVIEYFTLMLCFFLWLEHEHLHLHVQNFRLFYYTALPVSLSLLMASSAETVFTTGKSWISQIKLIVLIWDRRFLQYLSFNLISLSYSFICRTHTTHPHTQRWQPTAVQYLETVSISREIIHDQRSKKKNWGEGITTLNSRVLFQEMNLITHLYICIKIVIC